MRRALSLLATIALLAAGLSTATHSSAAAFTAHGSAKQVYATGLGKNATVELIDGKGKQVQSKKADSLGGVIFYKVAPGSGYKVRAGTTTSSSVTVHPETSAQWNPAIYKQSIPDSGYGYLTTRDGIKLAYTVHPPTSPAGLGFPNIVLPSGLPDYAPPYPTLIEYSGYGYANPDAPESSIAVIANLMGFAVVDVNMRGTGCSGGAYNFFEPLQNLDGYDVVETIARQPWVKNHKVGMMGISFGAISQLFTAQTQPPSLSAIAPLSTIDATATTLYPGGLLNDGFAVAWANERQQNAEPATGPGHGQSWAWDRIQAGDTTCKDNQVLHGMAADLPGLIAANTHYHADFADTIDPITLVDKIKVPVFLACQFQDEQTGGHCPDLVQHFTGTQEKWFTFTNGAHIDSLDPATFVRWYDFLELYVAKQAPMINAAVINAAAPVVYQMALGTAATDPILLPPDPIQLTPSYDSALAMFKKLPQVRVLFDNGAGTGPVGLNQAGDPYPGFEKSFSTFPVPGTVARRWYFGAGGTMTDAKPTTSGTNVYTSNPHALPMNDFNAGTGTGGLWGNASNWKWNWKPNPSGTAVSYLSAPLTSDATVFGAGAVTAWVKSSIPDVDLQVTVSEVDASGHETFVQNGWLRASERKLSTDTHNLLHQKGTEVAPILTQKQEDAAPMPSDRFVPVTIPLYYQGHTYRAGTRVRVTIAAPNGTQPIWSFKHNLPATGTSKVSVAFSSSMPSSLVLPVIPSVNAGSAQPSCGSLRNMPCRAYVPMANRTS